MMSFKRWQSILLVLFFHNAQAAVNDILPGDYYPLASGRTTLALYAFDRQYEGPYTDGNKKLDGSIDNEVLVLRAAHAFSVGEITMAGVAVLPWTHSAPKPKDLSKAMGGQSEGLSDIRLGVTAWLVNDKANANYLGLSGMVIAPTGQYDSKRCLNPGNNRWTYIFSGGWQKDIISDVLIEVSPELAWYSDNDEYCAGRVEKKQISSALTSYLRWRFSPTLHLHLGGQANWGGETRVGNTDNNNSANNKRITVGMTWFLPEMQQIILRSARDIEIDNGFRVRNELLLRYQKVF